jgi:hypothetical protein
MVGFLPGAVFWGFFWWVSFVDGRVGGRKRFFVCIGLKIFIRINI